MPIPLSSHTKRIGAAPPRLTVYRAALIPLSAVAWLADASPNEQHTMESSLKSDSAPRRRATRRAKAKPAAWGRCEAIVLVCGGTQRARLPHTLCRPPEIGSSEGPQNERISSRNGVG